MDLMKTFVLSILRKKLDGLRMISRNMQLKGQQEGQRPAETGAV